MTDTEPDVRPIYPVIVPGIEVQDPDGPPGQMIPWEILMYPPSPTQAMVLGRVSLESATGRVDAATGMNLIAVYRVLMALVVDPLDRMNLEARLLAEEIQPGPVLGLVLDVLNIHQATESDKQAPTTGPVVRRVRRK